LNPNQRLNQIFTTRWTDPGLVAPGIEMSYGALYARAAGIAAWLKKQGCVPGDRIALRLSNGWPFAVAYLACLLGRYTFVPINPELAVDDQSYIQDRAVPRLLIEDEQLLSRVEPITSDHPAFDYPTDEVAGIFFTSGTTGRPKGVCHRYSALVGNVMSFNDAMGLGPDTRMYHVLPMAYMAGFLNCLLSPWVAGGVALIGPRFKPAEALDFWRLPLEWSANTLWLTPTLAAILARMNRDPQIASRVRFTFSQIFCGTAPLTPTIRRSFLQAFGIALQESYGMSEILLVSAQTREDASNRTDVGRLLPGVQAGFRSLPNSHEQELILQTPYVLKSYVTEAGEASPLIPAGEWLAGGMPTGDIGHLDDGRLVISGRVKDLIIRGGLNVSPIAIEDVLLREPGVQEVAVVGAPHDFWGEAIHAFVVADPGMDREMLLSNLQQRCGRELADGTRPDRFIWLDTMPKAVTGKIQKHLLRNLAA